MVIDLVVPTMHIRLVAAIEVAARIMRIELIGLTTQMAVQIAQTMVIMDQYGVVFVILYTEIVENVEVS